MSPEEIRRIFAELAHDPDEVDWAIRWALTELKYPQGSEAKADSPYSLSKLTEGLSNGDAIIARALDLMQEDPTLKMLMNGTAGMSMELREKVESSAGYRFGSERTQEAMEERIRAWFRRMRQERQERGEDL